LKGWLKGSADCAINGDADYTDYGARDLCGARVFEISQGRKRRRRKDKTFLTYLTLRLNIPRVQLCGLARIKGPQITQIAPNGDADYAYHD
jgi:hypothetical protein